MALEIERRFLVSDPSIVAGRKGVSIRQAFLELKKEGFSGSGWPGNGRS